MLIPGCWARGDGSTITGRARDRHARRKVTLLEQRHALLTAALGFMQLDRWNEPKPPAMIALATWLDTWAGLGAIVTGMAAQGCDLQLTEYAGENWRATFFVTGMAHSIVKGSAYEPTPGRAVQRAAWEVVKRTP